MRFYSWMMAEGWEAEGFLLRCGTQPFVVSTVAKNSGFPVKDLQRGRPVLSSDCTEGLVLSSNHFVHVC